MKSYMEASRHGSVKNQHKGDVTLEELLAVQHDPTPKKGKKKLN